MKKQYAIIYADPPWAFKMFGARGDEKAADRHYKTLPLEKLMKLKPNAARNAILAMWVYDPMIPQALDLARAWGFRFVTVLFRWIKTTENPDQLALFPIEKPTPPFGLGYHTRGGGCEECWLFVRGAGLKVLRHDIRKEFYGLLREHSRKPDQVADWIVDLYGDKPRIEMFARTRRKGWAAMGNQRNKYRNRTHKK